MSGFARALLRPFRAEGANTILLQAKTARFIDFELGQLEAARAKIDRQKRFCIQHLPVRHYLLAGLCDYPGRSVLGYPIGR